MKIYELCKELRGVISNLDSFSKNPKESNYFNLGEILSLSNSSMYRKYKNDKYFSMSDYVKVLKGHLFLLKKLLDDLGEIDWSTEPHLNYEVYVPELIKRVEVELKEYEYLSKVQYRIW